MINQTCCFTGHRKIPLDQLESVTQRLRDAVLASIKDGYLYFGAGGALGFDTLAAQTVLNLKKDYQQIKLIQMCIRDSARPVQYMLDGSRKVQLPFPGCILTEVCNFLFVDQLSLLSHSF